jgi:hypothetical protein
VRAIATDVSNSVAKSQPRDSYELEADRMANQVIRMPRPRLQRACACGGGCPRCRAQGPHQEQEHLTDLLGSPGNALDTSTRAFMEPRFGYDLSHVRVHTDPRAAKSARSVDAEAYTFGHHIVFDAERFAPDTAAGRRLLAHELTHVVQQDGNAVHGRIQRQPRLGAAPPKRTTTYTFPGCTDDEIEILTRNIQQSYLMVVNARDQMTNLILSIAQAESSRRYQVSTDAIAVRRIVGRLFGADTMDVLRDVRHNFSRIEGRYRGDREVTCHDGKEHSKVASAKIGGTQIWIGPEFFSKYGDNLDARPRILIHEMAHNAGIKHDMTGIAIAAGSTETKPAEVAHHADSYAELAYRIYTRDFFGRMNRELEI